MIKILFVCHGNICRSPMAEFILKDMVAKQGLSAQFEIASAATSTEEIWNGVGNPVYPPAREELAKHGIRCDGKRAVQLKKSDYSHYDYPLRLRKIRLSHRHGCHEHPQHGADNRTQRRKNIHAVGIRRKKGQHFRPMVHFPVRHYLQRCGGRLPGIPAISGETGETTALSHRNLKTPTILFQRFFAPMKN